MMADLKAAFDGSTDYKRRLAILTLSPYQQEKTAEYFGTTTYMVKKSRELKRKHGVLPELQGMDHRGRRINEDLRANVQSFYETDETGVQLHVRTCRVTLSDLENGQAD
ncbi:hypothetical protein FJT64_020745 [Amphibalanus amphitrite]|uniref:Uncharacterized protein n=1 Tax=Amphibalanus amphitrite TaxID=1232801 RepID=A0A6A4X0V6_AMPAM|nr:hypothetical protein FJT64_020745 [Amphibalanus amphitrite]